MNHHPIKAFPLRQQEGLLNQAKRIPSPGQPSYQVAKHQDQQNLKKPASHIFLDSFAANEEAEMQMRRSKSSNILRKQLSSQAGKAGQSYLPDKAAQENFQGDAQLDAQSQNLSSNNGHKRTQSSTIAVNSGISTKPMYPTQQRATPNHARSNNGSFGGNMVPFSSESKLPAPSNKSQNGKQQFQIDQAYNAPKRQTPMASVSSNSLRYGSIPSQNKSINKVQSPNSIASNSFADKLPKLDPLLQYLGNNNSNPSMNKNNSSASPNMYHHVSGNISSKEQLKSKLQNELFKDPLNRTGSNQPFVSSPQGMFSKPGTKININLQIKNLNIIQGGRPSFNNNNGIDNEFSSHEPNQAGDTSVTKHQRGPTQILNYQANRSNEVQNLRQQLINNVSNNQNNSFNSNQHNNIQGVSSIPQNSYGNNYLLRENNSDVVHSPSHSTSQNPAYLNRSLQQMASPPSQQQSKRARSNSKEKFEANSSQQYQEQGQNSSGITYNNSADFQGKYANPYPKPQPGSQQQQLLNASESSRKSIQKQLGSSSTDIKQQGISSTQNRKQAVSPNNNLKDSFGGLQQPKQLQAPPTTVTKSIVSNYAVKSKAGALPGKPVKTNQDSYIITPNFCKNKLKYFFSVCDGHGVNGHLASQYVKKILGANIEFFLKQFCREVEDPSKPYPPENFSAISQALTSAYLKTASSLLDSGIDITFSGSTCVGVYMTPERFWCANIGDSRAIVGRQDSISGVWSNQPLSIDHKPDLPGEQARILKSGGRVDPFKDQDGNPIGPARVWMRYENIPGLAMARSFGDYVASQVGVIPEPEVLHFDFTPNDRFLAVASDGIWEFLSNEDVVSMIAPFYVKNDPEGACEKLVKEAVAAWKREDEVIDDITIIIVFFNK